MTKSTKKSEMKMRELESRTYALCFLRHETYCYSCDSPTHLVRFDVVPVHITHPMDTKLTGRGSMTIARAKGIPSGQVKETSEGNDYMMITTYKNCPFNLCSFSSLFSQSNLINSLSIHKEPIQYLLAPTLQSLLFTTPRRLLYSSRTTHPNFIPNITHSCPFCRIPN
jgi:hypothetical protein